LVTGGERRFFRHQLGEFSGHERITPLYRDLQICEVLGKFYSEWMLLHEDERHMWRKYFFIKAKKEEERRVENENRRELEEYDKVKK
jgi:hypothetical protein